MLGYLLQVDCTSLIAFHGFSSGTPPPPHGANTQLSLTPSTLELLLQVRLRVWQWPLSVPSLSGFPWTFYAFKNENYLRDSYTLPSSVASPRYCLGLFAAQLLCADMEENTSQKVYPQLRWSVLKHSWFLAPAVQYQFSQQSQGFTLVVLNSKYHINGPESL